MYLGVIPARGGSKGIPRKNILEIAGHPLIAWTIKDALASKRLDRFIVSTEDVEIGWVAHCFKAEVLKRPEELAGDAVLSRDVVAHALEEMGGDVAVLLQCTSPIRREGLIDRAIEAYERGGYDSVSTGFEHLNYPPFGTEHRRQDLSTVFVNDGSVIVSDAKTVLGGSLFGKRPGTLVTTREENVDIDSEFDFFVAERILEKGLAEGWMSPPQRII